MDEGTQTLRRLTTSILIAAALACGRNEAGARLRVPAPRSEVAGSIAQVRVRVTGAGVDREHALSPQSGEWEAFFGDLPAAEELLFHGEALDAEGATLFAGDADPVILSPGESANLRLTLASLAPAAPFADHAPRIDFLTAPDVIDDAGDALTYAWTATAGAFADPAAPATSWSPGAATGPQQLTLRVTDSHGAADSVSFAIDVR